MNKMRIQMFAFLMALLLVSPVLAACYEWVDADGVVHLGDRPPPGDGNVIEHKELAPAGRGEREMPGSEEASALEAAELAMKIGDDVKAFVVLKALAQRGNVRAQSDLGLIYSRGLAVARDLETAFSWHRRAAEKGYDRAQYYLGLMYADGEGVTKNASLAVKWLCKAADQGLAQAQFSLGTMYARGEGVERDYGRAAEWHRKAADQGVPEAQYVLGLMYETGQGVERDGQQAKSWLEQAATQGYLKAQERLDAKAGVAPRRERIKFSFDDGEWQLGYQHEDSQHKIMEFVRKGETVNAWSELVTMQNFALTPKDRPRTEMYAALMWLRERECPGSTVWHLIDLDEKSILFEWQATPCAGWPNQHEISRYLDGKWNRYRLAYTAKVRELPAEKRALWIRDLSAARIEDEP